MNMTPKKGSGNTATLLWSNTIGNATAEDDHFAIIALLDTEQGRARLSERRQVGSCLEDPGG